MPPGPRPSSRPPPAQDGVLYYRDWSQNGTEFAVPPEDIDDVLVIDGFERTVMTVNGMVPGPAIEVYEGTQVRRRVEAGKKKGEGGTARCFNSDGAPSVLPHPPLPLLPHPLYTRFI